ncbi:hypothetical protein COBT_002586 [Conglomerata obtusa]
MLGKIYIFLLSLYINSQLQFDPAKSKHRTVMTFLDEVVRHFLQKETDVNELKNTLRVKKGLNLEIVHNKDKKIVLIDKKERVAYKISILDYEGQRGGDSLAKDIDSNYICKIYDFIKTTISITHTKQSVHLIVMAMEMLTENIDSFTFYSNIKEKYFNESKYNDRMLFYTEIIKPKVQKILKHLASGVKIFHDKKVGSLDIKDKNLMSIIIEDKEFVKLIDFESAIHFKEDGKNYTEYTPAYSSPEMLFDNTVSFAMDIWSIGILGYYLITGEPFGRDDDLEIDRYKDFVIMFLIM